MTTGSFWDLMRDCIPTGAGGQVPDTHYLDAALASLARPATVVEIGRDSGGTAGAASRGAPIGEGIVWDSVSLASATTMPHATASVPLVSTVGAFERSVRPQDLAREITRVLQPGGRLVGSVAQLEPYNDLALWNFTAVGFRAVLEEAGLRLLELRPGIDAVALVLYWVHGRSEEHASAFEGSSPLNAEFQSWGEATGRGPDLVNNRALQFCGRFAFVAEKPASGAGGPTAWRERLDAAIAESGLAQSAAAIHVDGISEAPSTARAAPPFAFRLALPKPPDADVGVIDRLRRAVTGRGGNRPERRPIQISATRDRYIAKELERQGLAGYEPETLACFLAALEFAPPGWVYDVGANIGVFAVLAAALGARPVVAFEPTPDLASVARDIGRDNGLSFEVEELALAREPGEATFYLSDKSDASNSLAAGFRPSTRSLTVTVDTLDRFVDRTGRTPGLLKVDTETTEADVLAGAAATIERYRPWILVEILAGRREADLTAVVEPFRYRWHHITDAVPAPERDALAGDPKYRYRNWLLVPDPPDPAFWQRVRRWRAALDECVPERRSSA
jgi:FkbM family methyltransferase